jgi:hypothetical protein
MSSEELTVKLIMIPTKKKFTAKEHAEHAKTFVATQQELEKFWLLIFDNFGGNHKATKYLRDSKRKFLEAIYALDSEYYKHCLRTKEEYGDEYIKHYVSAVQGKPSSPQSPNDEGRVL